MKVRTLEHEVLKIAKIEDSGAKVKGPEPLKPGEQRVFEVDYYDGETEESSGLGYFKRWSKALSEAKKFALRELGWQTILIRRVARGHWEIVEVKDYKETWSGSVKIYQHQVK